MPAYFELISREKSDKLLSWAEKIEAEGYDEIRASEDGKYIHKTVFLKDAITSQRVGKLVFNSYYHLNDNSKETLGIDMTLLNEERIELFVLERIREYGDKNIRLQVVTGEGATFIVEPVNIHCVEGEIRDKQINASISACPFQVEVFKTFDEFCEEWEFYPGDSWHCGEDYWKDNYYIGTTDNSRDLSIVVGKIVSMRIICIETDQGKIRLLVAQVETAIGKIPTLISLEEYDLHQFNVGNTILMSAYIKADLALEGKISNCHEVIEVSANQKAFSDDVDSKKIGAGSAVIIVYDKSFEDFNNTWFKEYLEKEGFERWTKGHTYDTSWVYVNINSKLYTKGMPGIPVTTHLGNHAVTIEEFMAIYGIYKKYEGKSVLKF